MLEEPFTGDVQRENNTLAETLARLNAERVDLDAKFHELKQSANELKEQAVRPRRRPCTRGMRLSSQWGGASARATRRPRPARHTGDAKGAAGHAADGERQAERPSERVAQ